MSAIRLLIVDDSGFMRLAIKKMVETDPNIQVIGEARNGAQGLKMVKEMRPDVVTMDIEMPEMDGLTATQRIMAECPTPVIMLSSLTQEGAEETMKALSYGAVDFISKSSSFVQLDIVKIDKELREKITYWGRRTVGGGGRLMASAPKVAPSAGMRPRPGAPIAPRPTPPKPTALVRRPAMVDLVVVGISTGGPRMFPEFLKAMGSAIKAPMVVAQHMPELYTKSFAAHLDKETGIRCVEASQGMELKSGEIAILPGGVDSVIRLAPGGKRQIRILDQSNTNIHPNADVLFESALNVAMAPLAVIMTGMGADGTKGAKGFHAKGFPVLVQEPETCVVGGMPSAAMEAGVVSQALPLDALGRRVAEWVGKA